MFGNAPSATFVPVVGFRQIAVSSKGWGYPGCEGRGVPHATIWRHRKFLLRFRMMSEPRVAACVKIGNELYSILMWNRAP